MHRPRDQSGFSLLEMLIASAIFFSFMVGLLGLYSRGHRTYTRGQNKIEVQQSARIAMDGIASELRMAGYDPSDAIVAQSPDAALQVAEADSLTFLADLDADGSTDRVTYRLDGSQLVRRIARWDGASFVDPIDGLVAEGVTLLQFNYFDSDGFPVVAPVSGADLNEVERIVVEIEATVDRLGIRESYPLFMDVTLRNLQANDDGA